MSEARSPTVLGLDYNAMLERGLAKIPKDLQVKEAWKLPEPEIVQEDNRTVITNWKDIIFVLNRDEKLVIRYLEHRLGTVGWSQKNKAIFQGRHKRYRIARLLELFAKEYVICDVCGSPHTVLLKDKSGMWIKKCQACGAWRAVERI